MSGLTQNQPSRATGNAAPSPKKPHPPVPLAVIDKTAVNIGAQSDLINLITFDALTGRGGTVFTLNLDHLVKLEHDAAFRAAYESATYVSADGAPVVAMARQQGADIVRVTGADLVRPLCAAAALARIPVHFFGTNAETLTATRAILKAENPRLVVAGMESPPYGFSPFGADARAAAERIAKSGARICFVALGAPKQEIFTNFARQWAPQVTFVCIGAALDFIGGGQVRAPAAFQALGLEWMWRLIHDPKRLTKRYLLSAMFLLRYNLKTLFGRMRRTPSAAGPETHRD